MEEGHRKILRINRTYIVNNLSNSDVLKLVDYLIEHDLLTDNMGQDVLEAENTPIKRARALLDILPKRGPTSFRILCDALIASKLCHVAEQLDPSLIGSAEQPAASNKPVQASSNNNASSGKQSMPVPMSVGTSSLPGATGSQPTPEKREPALGRQVSREVEKTYPPSDEQEDIISDNWPENLNVAPFGSSDFTLKACNQTDLKSQLPLINDELAYPLTSLTRGRALIVNNFYYDDPNIAERFNSDNDSMRIQFALSALKFKVVTRANVTLEVLRQELKKETMFDQSDAFILVILSYGGNGTVLCIDGKEMAIQDIVNMFSSRSCPSLAGKPKMFFIQACGGRLKDSDKREFSRSESVQSLDSVISGLESMKLNQPVDEDFPDTTPGLYPQTDTSDMMVAVATSPDTDCEGGAAKKNYNSIFILGLAYVLCNYSHNKHLLHMLKTINNLMKDADSRQPVQLCEVRQSLTKKLYLLPGYASDLLNTEDDFQSLGSSKPIH